MKDLDLSKAVRLNSSAMKATVINCEYAARMFLGKDIDGYNDRVAYAHEGGSYDDSYTWVITEVGSDDNNEKIYSIQNHSYRTGFLFRGSSKDEGDYDIYGHNSDVIDSSKGDRYKFYMREVGRNPVRYSIVTLDGFTLYAGVHKDGDGDHRVYARSGQQSESRFQWYVFPV